MSSEAKLSCEICHKKFKFSSTYKIHVNKHTRASTKKLQCDKTTKLIQHLKADNQKLTGTFVGTQNSKDLKQQNFDEEHVIRRAGKNLIYQTAGEDFKKSLLTKSNETSHIQPKDDARKRTVENLTVDVNMEVENEELSDLQKGSSQDFQASVGTESAGQLDDQTRQKRNLRKRSNKTKDKPVSDKTGQKGKQKKKKVDQVFACKICQKFFSNKQNLVAHKNKHLGVRHKCDQCGLTYSSKYSLKTHLLWHKNLKPWECEQCGAQFLQNGHYRRHLKIHSGQRDEICDQCGKSFPGRDGLRAHKQTHVNHAGYECHVCGVRLKLKSSLRNHMKLHKEGKEYTCNVCKRSFSQKKCYLNHKKLHNSSYVKRKAYLNPIQESCELCNKGFVNSAGLKKHLRKHELGLLKRFNSLNLEESQRISDDRAMRNIAKHGSSGPGVERFEKGRYEQCGFSSTVCDTEKTSGCNPDYLRHKSERGERFEKPFDRNIGADWSQQQTLNVHEIQLRDPVQQTKESDFLVPNKGLEIIKSNDGKNEILKNHSFKSISKLCDPQTNLILSKCKHTDTQSINSATDTGFVPSSGYILSNNPVSYSTNTLHSEGTVDSTKTDNRHRVNISKHSYLSNRESCCLHTDTRKSDSPQGEKIIVPTGQVEEKAYQYTEGDDECLVYVVEKCDKENDINTDRSVQIVQSINGTEKLRADVSPSHSKSSSFKSHDMAEAIQNKETFSIPSRHFQDCKPVQQNELSQKNHGTVQVEGVGSGGDQASMPINTHLNGSLRTVNNCYENVTLRTNTNVVTDASETPLSTLGLGSNEYDGSLEQAGVSHQLQSERETKNILNTQNSYRNVVNDDTVSNDSTEEGTDLLSDTETAGPTDKTNKNSSCTQQAQEHTHMEFAQTGSSGSHSVLPCDALNPKKKCRKKHKMMSPTTHAKSICEHCGKTFSQTNHLYRHIRLRSCLKRYECSLCCRAFRTGGSLLKHMRKDHNLRFLCNLCDKSFASSSSLRKHKKYHVNDSPYLYVPKLFECKICGNRYTASSSLKTHLLQHKGHTYICNFCGKEYGQKSHLARHIAAVHHGIKQYKCDISGCGKGFIDSRALHVHKRSHSGEKPYQCNTCGKFFTESQNLKVHMKKHLNVKEFKCDICEQEFTTKMSMLRHYKRHEKAAKEAETAGQASSRKCRVKKMAEKTLSCSHECGSMFTTRRGLIVHMKKHCPFKNSSGADNSVSTQVQNVLLGNNVNL